MLTAISQVNTHRGHRLRSIILLGKLAIIVIYYVVSFGAAQAAPNFSAVVLDAANGRVLFSQNPGAPSFPASLTKVMTLYIVFEELQAERLKLSSEMICSANCASRPPSKLGLKRGDLIVVEVAIKALVTRSANDVATVFAEHISGSEKEFARRMTRTAKAIGMSRSTFRNASGLPDPQQITTARDMATLGLHVQQKFPDLYRYFGIANFSYQGKIIRSHNKLLGRYPGTDGIKTGYIRASGFNLIISTMRDSKRLIGVVMGGKTQKSRDAYMMKMLDEYFSRASPLKQDSLQSAGFPAAAPQTIEELVENSTASENQRERDLGGPASRSSNDVDRADGDLGYLSATAAAEPVQFADSLPQEPRRTWQIQLGAYPTEEGALRTIQKATSLSLAVLAGRTSNAIRTSRRKTTLYRARFSGFDENSARDACSQLEQKGLHCLTIAPHGS